MTAPWRRRAPRHLALGVAVIIGIVTACGGDDDATDPTDGDSGPAVIVTTTEAPITAPTTTIAPTTTPTTEPDGDTDDPGPAATTTTPATTPTTAPPTTAPPTTAPRAPLDDPAVTFTEIGSFDQPIGLARRVGDPLLYLVEQPGRVIAFDPDTGSARTVLDITDLTASRGEQGLLGLTFSPDGTRAHTNHTRADTAATVVSEFPVGADGTFDRDAMRVLLEVEQPYGNHNGGHLETGPDGLLYIGMGDGGSGGDPLRLGLDVSSPHGSILRIDPTPSGDLPYTIPPDNPFLDVDGAIPETFAIGLRNPWKFGFDPVTSDLWIADVGQNELEEINFVAAVEGSVAGAGLSFGWSAFEGTSRFNTDEDPDGHTDPVLVYDHSEGDCSISGGAPYRGDRIEGLAGGYVYSDYCSGRVWALDLVGEQNLLLGRVGSQIVAVLPGPDLELYVLSQAGPVYRIDPA